MKMEMTNLEVAAVEEAASARTEAAYRELSEMQFALTGGGSGDVSLG
jgi:hypothetical protein